MTRLTIAFSFLTLAAALSAQSTLTTTFASNNSGSPGGGVCFNLVASRGITIGGIDCNLWDSPGTPGTIELWILPGVSHVGRETSATGWVLAASGPVQAAGLDQPSHVNFTAPYFLAAGNYGVAICHVGVGAAYTNGTGSNQSYSTPELTLNAGSALNACFTAGTVFTPRVWNGSIYYTLGNQIAQVQRSGSGCVDGVETFYEFLTALNTFDLSNQSFEMVPFGTGYRVQRGTGTYVTPNAGTSLALTDDSLSGPLNLGFPLPFPGGSTTTVMACSNGYIYLGSGAEADFTPSPGEALSGGRRLFPFWTDLLPDGGATRNVFFQAEPANQLARVTWVNVPEYNNAASSNTFQVVFYATGRIEVIYRACANTSQTVLVGYSPGANSRDPGSRDLSATMPFLLQRDGNPLSQNATRPVMGTVCTLQVSGIPVGSLGGIEMIGPAVPGIDLTSAGMPGCFLYVSPLLVSLPFATGAATANLPLPIPNDPALVGTQVPVQAVTVSPGTTPLGAVTSNLATLVLGPL